jgi:hypothetical protein
MFQRLVRRKPSHIVLECAYRVGHCKVLCSNYARKKFYKIGPRPVTTKKFSNIVTLSVDSALAIPFMELLLLPVVLAQWYSIAGLPLSSSVAVMKITLSVYCKKAFKVYENFKQDNVSGSAANPT